MKRFVIACVSVVVAVVAVFAFVMLTPWFTVKTVEVHGAEHISSDEVAAATGVTVGERLATVSPRDAVKGVGALPWVKKATVSKDWPSTVTVSVVEEQAVAYQTTPDGTVLINAEGTPFVIDQPTVGAVEIVGASDPAVFSACLTAINELTPAVRKDVARVSAPSQYEITLELLDGRSVYWGSAEQAHNKAVATEIVLTREGQHFDVSNPQLVTLG